MTDTSFQASDTASKDHPYLANGMLIVTAIALAKFLFHCYFNNG